MTGQTIGEATADWLLHLTPADQLDAMAQADALVLWMDQQTHLGAATSSRRAFRVAAHTSPQQIAAFVETEWQRFTDLPGAPQPCRYVDDGICDFPVADGHDYLCPGHEDGTAWEDAS